MSTFAERISRKASAIVGANKPPQPEDPGALAKAEAALTEKREALAKAREKRDVATAEAVTTGDSAKVAAAVLELQAAHGDCEIAAETYASVRAARDAGAAAADLAKRVAALEKLLKPLYENGAAIDAWTEAGGKLFAERSRLYDAIIEQAPQGRYGALSIIGSSDFIFREGLAAHKIPGGAVTIRDLANRRTCASVHREIGAAAMSLLKPVVKRTPGA